MMYTCPKCGAELLDEALFCMNCGTKIESGNEKSLEFKDTDKKKSKKNAEENSKGLLLIFILIFILALAGAVAYLYFFTDFFRAKIDLNKYIEVDFEGYNTIGHAELEFDRDKLESDYGKSINSSMKKFMANFNYKLDKAELLSNDDVVTLSWEYDTDEIKEEYDVVIFADEKTYTVSGLKDLEIFDPFDGVELEFSGISPMGSALISKTPDSNGLRYSLSNYNSDLKNGDSVTVTVSYGQLSEEEYADKYGHIPAVKEKAYIVSGLDEYILSFSDIPDDIIDKVKSQASDCILSYVANNYSSSSSLGTLEYAGYIYLTKKDDCPEQEDEDLFFEASNNILMMILKGTVSNSENAFISTDVYFPVLFENFLNENGSISYREDNSIAGNSTFSNDRYRTNGYTNPLTCYSELTSNMEAFYNVECGDGIEKFGEYTAALSIDEINPELKQELLEESKNIMDRHIVKFNEGSHAGYKSNDDVSYVGEYMLTAKNQGTNLAANNIYYVIYTATIYRKEDVRTVYYPVKYEGIINFGDDDYYVLNKAGITGESQLSYSYFVKGYFDEHEMYKELITANRVNYTYEITGGLQEFE